LSAFSAADGIDVDQINSMLGWQPDVIWGYNMRLSKAVVYQGLLAGAMLSGLSASHAADTAQQSVTFYHGHGVDADLLGIPKQIFQGDVKWEDSYFEGVSYAQSMPMPDLLNRALDWVYLSDSTLRLEGLLIQHRGMQHNLETSFAYMLHTDYLELSGLRLRAGAGLGLSYAFGTPTYEDGPKDNPEKRYRFQNYNAYEIESSLADYPNLALAFRVHHRSGMYGVIAPRHVGSNFLTLGLRYQF
jgi:hypothetical protein